MTEVEKLVSEVRESLKEEYSVPFKFWTEGEAESLQREIFSCVTRMASVIEELRGALGRLRDDSDPHEGWVHDYASEALARADEIAGGG